MKFKNLEVLSKEDILQIHEASIDILENTGVVVLSNKILDILANKGAKVDYDKKLVKMPRELVEDSLKKAPSTFSLFDRNRKEAMVIGDGIPKCASGHNAVFVIDSKTNERRESTVKDVEEFALISDKLKDIDIVGVPLNPKVEVQEATLIYAVKALYENTTKPIFFSTESSKVNNAIIELMKIVSGEGDISKHPSAISQLSPTSPLYWEEGAVDAIYDVSKVGIPLNILPEPMSGVSAPYSVAGLLTVHNIEVLSGAVIAQLINPGTPIMYGSSWTTYDMKYTNAIIASPESSILRVAGCQMARFYNIPSHTTAPNSDSNLHDEQNSWEKTTSNFCAICAGNDVVMNSGMFATGLTVSLEQLVMDDEMNGIIRRIYRGVEVNKESIAKEVIDNVGPRGNFLMEDHTLNNLRSGEFRENTISNMEFYDNWLTKGMESVTKKASLKAEEILKAGNDNKLDEKIIAKMQKVIYNFEKEVR